MLRAATLLLLGCLGVLGAQAANLGVGSYMYGLNRTTQEIIEFNPVPQTKTTISGTGLTALNANAFDMLRSQLIILGKDSADVWSFYVWDMSTDTLAIVAP